MLVFRKGIEAKPIIIILSSLLEWSECALYYFLLQKIRSRGEECFQKLEEERREMKYGKKKRRKSPFSRLVTIKDFKLFFTEVGRRKTKWHVSTIITFSLSKLILIQFNMEIHNFIKVLKDLIIILTNERLLPHSHLLVLQCQVLGSTKVS